MALFRIYRGNPSDLDEVPLVDGHSYVCYEDDSDTATFWTDVPDSQNQLHRVQICTSGPLQFSASETLTLDKDDWAGNAAPYTQTLTTTNSLVNNQNGVIDLAQSATAEQREAERNALLHITGQTLNTITITADGEKPSVDIPIVLTLFFSTGVNFAGEFLTGVKGDAESTYRTGDVNITPANIGVYTKAEVDAKLNTSVVDHTVYMSTQYSVADHTVTFNS